MSVARALAGTVNVIAVATEACAGLMVRTSVVVVTPLTRIVTLATRPTSSAETTAVTCWPALTR